MKKIRFGTPEKFVPSAFCKNFNYKPTELSYDIEKIAFKQTQKGVIIEIPLEDDEQVYGFGLQFKGFNHKGLKLTLRVNSDPSANTGDTHAPVPFFVTNKGYGIYIDTARYIEAYCGFSKKKTRTVTENHEIKVSVDELYKKEKQAEITTMTILVPSVQGIDLFLFEGKNITEIVAQYNMLSGGGCNAPEWALGPLYRCYGRSNSDDIRKIAEYFRAKDIPCDILGFEPGWQSGSYPCTFEWDKSRFPDFKELIEELKDAKYHINLWEHAYVSPNSPLYDKLYEGSGEYEVWKGLVPDFALQETKNTFADYHRDNFASLGIDGFKLDECDNGDFREDWGFPNCAVFPSGMDGEQYHSLFGTLYMQTIMQAIGDKGTLSEVRSCGALASSYPFVLYSDLYDHKEFIRALVNSGFSGILWAPEVREAKTKKELICRLWNVVFSVQCVINGWYYENMPWQELDCENEVRKILKERKKLIPKIKAALDKYQQFGIPPVRALVMDFTDDSETYFIDDEYMFCDNLLVAPVTSEQENRRVYLPKGRWRNYWTGENYDNGWICVEGNTIPVFEKI